MGRTGCGVGLVDLIGQAAARKVVRGPAAGGQVDQVGWLQPLRRPVGPVAAAGPEGAAEAPWAPGALTTTTIKQPNNKHINITHYEQIARTK